MGDQKKSRRRGASGAAISLPACPLCGESLSATTSYSIEGEAICLHCLLHLGPERVRILLKVNSLDPLEVEAAVTFLRGLLTRNQTLRLRETIQNGGRNWWVKLPEFGEYVCRRIMERGGSWDSEVLDEVWDRLIEEAVEE